MIENRLRLIPLSEITFPPDRQREAIDPKTLLPLALSIAEHGLIQNIGIKEETKELIFGGRRYHAGLLCQAVHNELEHELLAAFSADELEQLKTALAKNPLYDDWTKFPARLAKGVGVLSTAALEFLENACREDLSWQEKAKACTAIHRQAVTDARERKEIWNESDTARMLGIDMNYLGQLMAPFRKAANITDEDVRKKAEQAINESPSAVSARRSVETIAERHGISTELPLMKGLKLKTEPTKKAPEPRSELKLIQATEQVESLGQRSIICADFNIWAPAYTGPQFNFIHCDFPYGVEFNKSVGQGTSAATRSVGEYDDGEEVYWKLLSTLLSSRDRLLASSTHIMFWLSVGDSKIHNRPMVDVTKETILAAWSDADISSVNLIWHCTDNSGLMPDPKRKPRRTYEVALHITLGDRPIAKGKAASFGYPRNSDDKLHRSQKHGPVLAHFFEMFVDSSTRMLDPTCGSGTSVLTAHTLGAKMVLGLEIDDEMRASAVKNFDQETKQ